MFSCEHCEIFKNTYFEKHLRTTASVNSRSAIFQESLVLPFKLNALTSGISWQHTHSNLVGISTQFWQLHHSWELNLLCWVTGSRSSRPDVFCKMWSVFCQRPEACNFIKKENLAQAFSCEFYEISKNSFFHRTPLVAASVVVASIVVTWASWFSGHRFRLEAEDFIFHILWKFFFQISAWKYLFCVQEKVCGVFVFPYFVLSWYILVQSMELFKVWLKPSQNRYFFSFSIHKWHINV